MRIEFRKEVRTANFLDPANDFAEKSIPVEFRHDPLTTDMGIVVQFRITEPQKPDLSQLVARSLELGCPFCPEVVEKVTPKFIRAICNEGRIKVGEAIVFPNTMPYVPYSAVAVVSAKHFVSLREFSPQMLSDAFIASVSYFQKVQDYDPELRYCCIIWNYMPPAQSSLVHSHLHVLPSHVPLPYQQKLLDLSHKYRKENGASYWSDLVAQEKRLGQRYIGEVGSTVWLTSFVPRSTFFDIVALFSHRYSLTSLSSDDIHSFCQGLTTVFRYMADKNFYSFNLCLYSGGLEGDGFWIQARVVPRATLPPLGMSDVGNLTLLSDTRLIIRSPESVCQELRPYFGG